MSKNKMQIGRMVIRPTILLITLFLLAFCSPKAEKEQNQSDQQQESIDTTPVRTLSPLVEGEVLLKDDVFGEIIELKGESKPVNQIFAISETQMLAEDHWLIVKNHYDFDYFMIYSLPDFQFVKSFGRMGQGPQEFENPVLVQTEDNNALCYILEATRNKLYSLDRHFKINELPLSLPSVYHSYRSGQYHGFSRDDFVLVEPTEDGKAIFRLQSSGDSISKKLIHNLSFSKSHRNWAAYIGDFGASKKMDRMVYAYKYFKRLVFMDTSGENIRTLVFKTKKTKTGDALTILGPYNVTHYWGMSAQEKHVYVLYSGRTPIDVGKELKTGNGSIYIEQFDWNGNPIRKFKLDHWGYFCVDEKANKIYLASITEEIPFFVFELPERIGKAH